MVISLNMDMAGRVRHVALKIYNRQSALPLGRRERELLARVAAGAVSLGGRSIPGLWGGGADNMSAGECGQRPSGRAARRRYARPGVPRRDAPEITLILTDDAGIAALNREKRGIDGATDVLSFPLVDWALRPIADGVSAGGIRDPQTGRPLLGEVVISPERAAAQAAEYGHSTDRELAFLLAHGVLHLLGYDHEGGGDAEREMYGLTERVLTALGLGREGEDEPGCPILAAEPAEESARPAARTDAPAGYRAGFVAVLGRPNAGKSTLINALTGNPLAIVSHKPQTTRRNARMIVTTDAYQLILVDTPGIHSPKSKLGEQMMRRAKGSVREVDAILLMIDARDKRLGVQDEGLLAEARSANIPVVLIINKIDLVQKETLLPLIASVNERFDFAAVIPLSARSSGAPSIVLPEIVKLLPPGAPLYPDDMITDQTERQLVADIIREKALKLLNQEVPHGIEVEIEVFRHRERDGLYEIYATIYCERETHKKIVIGKNGETLKRVGASARADIERMQGGRVFLNLWVKVRKDWRDDEAMLRRMGYYDRN